MADQIKYSSNIPNYQPSPAYLGGTIEENLIERTAVEGVPQSMYSKSQLSELTQIYKNENVANPTAAFAQDIATTLSGDFPEDPEWFTYEGNKLGISGFAKAFNDGNPMSDADQIETFSVDTEGNPITMPTLFGSEKLGAYYQGVKEEAVPALAEAGSFAMGFKLTNDYLNKIRYKGTDIGFGPLKIKGSKPITRALAPFFGGFVSSFLGRTGGEKIQELAFGPDVPILPEAEAMYKFGQGTTEGLSYSAMPYAIGQNINLGYELIKNDLTRGMLKKQKGSSLYDDASSGFATKFLQGTENLLQGSSRTVRGATAAEIREAKRLGVDYAKGVPLRFGAAEVASNLGAGAAQAQNILDPQLPMFEIAREAGYSLLFGNSADVVLRKIPALAETGLDLVTSGAKLAYPFRTADNSYRQAYSSKKQREKQTEISEWLYKALADAGEDPEAVIAALNSKEFNNLLDSDGSTVKPTAGTKSLSPTLLGLEGALNFIGNGLQDQRSSAQIAITQGIRNKIRGLYATGDRAALQEAAALTEGIFDAAINKRVYQARLKLNDAFEKLRTDPATGQRVASSKDEAKVLFKLFEDLMKADRLKESGLWNKIPQGTEITQFFDAAGNKKEVPSFVESWNKNVTSLTAESQVLIPSKLMDSLGAFVTRKTDELGIGPETTVAEPVNKRLASATQKFQNLFTGIVGTENGEREFRELVNSVSELPVSEQVTSFRIKAQEKAGKFSSATGKKWAAASNAYADMLSIRNNLDTPPVPTVAKPVNEAVIPFQDAADVSFKNLQDAVDDNPLRGSQISVSANNAALEMNKLTDATEIDEVLSNFIEMEGGADLNATQAAAVQMLSDQAALVKAKISNPTPDSSSQLVSSDGKGLSAKEVFDMRSSALSLARELDAAGDVNGSRIAYEFAGALLDDLQSFPQGVNFAYDTARAFSKAFNKTYTQTFAGDLSAVDSSGARKIPPELLARELQGIDVAYLHVKELDAVGQFQQQQMLGNLIDGGQLDVLLRGDLMGAQTASDPRVVQLREGFESVIDPESEMLDIPKYKAWLQTNQQLLSEVAPDLAEESFKILETVNTVRGTTENVLRNIRENAIDPDTQTVTPSSLKKWMTSNNNALMLKAFPALEADLLDIQKANVLLAEDTKLAKKRKNDVLAQSSFYELMMSSGFDKNGTENPTTAIAKALRPSNDKPIESLNRLFSVIGQLDAKTKPLGDLTVSDPTRVKGVTKDLTSGTDVMGYTLPDGTTVPGFDVSLQGPTTLFDPKNPDAPRIEISREEAIKGFRVSLIEHVLSKAGGDAGEGAWSATSAYKQFFEPQPNSQNKVSVAEWAESKGVMTKGQLDNMKMLFGEMAKYEQTLMSGTAQDFEDLVKKMGPGLDVALSIVGSSAGTRARNLLVGPGGSGDLIVSGRAAEAARTAGRNLMEKIPEAARMDMLKKMFEDPELLADLLRKGGKPSEKPKFALKAFRILRDFIEPSSSAFRLARPALLRGELETTDMDVSEDPDFLLGSKPSYKMSPEQQERLRQQFLETYVKPDQNSDELLRKARKFLDNRDQSSLQPPLNEALPPVRQATVPNGVQTATATAPVDPVGTTGIASLGGTSRIDVDKARKLFPNDITFAARGGAISSGIGAFR